MEKRVTVLLIAMCLHGTAATFATYDEQRSSAVKTCEAIDPSDAQSGLLFNPDGYRSFYVRSQCFQEAAVRFRDPALCGQVRQRRSWFSSSWGYSAARCRELVSEGVSADRKALEDLKRAYANGGVRLRDFRIERNGNGRDFDILPALVGDYAHGYTLTFEILLPEAPGSPVLLHSSGYYLDAMSNLRIYVRQVDVKQRLAAFVPNRSYTVRGTVALDVGGGGLSGLWSDAFIESVFPIREREQPITRKAAF